MRLLKRLIELAFVIFVISLFMKNKDIVISVNYFGLSEPITIQFWELVTFCVAIGIIIAAVGDFVTQLKWIRERRRMIKTDREHQSVVDDLNQRIVALDSENQRLKKELDQKIEEISDLKAKSNVASEPIHLEQSTPPPEA